MCDWSMDMSLFLIDLYEQHPVLWDPKHYYYYSKENKLYAWEMIAQSMNLDVKIVRQKMDSLLGSFRAQRNKGKKSIGTGANKRDVYISKWFAFEKMHFLLDKDGPRNNTSAETGNSDLMNESGPSTSLSDEYYDETTTIIETHDNHVMLLDNDQSNITVDEADDCHPQEKENKDFKHQSKIRLAGRRRVEQSYDMQDGPLYLYSAARAQPMPLQDRFSTYGEHVANKLRTYSTRTQAIVEHAINNILFEADMGNYEKSDGNDPLISNHFKCPVVSSSTALCPKSEPL